MGQVSQGNQVNPVTKPELVRFIHRWHKNRMEIYPKVRYNRPALYVEAEVMYPPEEAEEDPKRKVIPVGLIWRDNGKYHYKGHNLYYGITEEGKVKDLGEALYCLHVLFEIRFYKKERSK